MVCNQHEDKGVPIMGSLLPRVDIICGLNRFRVWIGTRHWLIRFMSIYSSPNMVLLEVLEEYYELHREEIEQQVAELKEDLRQTIKRYEGKRLWLRGKSRLWLESKRHFLAELDREYPDL